MSSGCHGWAGLGLVARLYRFVAQLREGRAAEETPLVRVVGALAESAAAVEGKKKQGERRGEEHRSARYARRNPPESLISAPIVSSVAGELLTVCAQGRPATIDGSGASTRGEEARWLGPGCCGGATARPLVAEAHPHPTGIIPKISIF